ncbi:MAG: hypothetical protein IKC58_05880 [Clostridia bacterium]|nr:hypothetical protein [Clostridia bacterium]
MKQFLTLVKLLFSQQFRAKAVGDKKKRTGIVIAFVVLGICFLPMIIGVVVGIYTIGQLSGADQGVVAFLILLCQSLVLMLGLPSLISGVYMPKDADKLLYLPVKPATIFSAKLAVAYLNEVITTAATILFLLVPYGIGANMGVGYYLMLLPALLLIPMLPILLGTIIAMPFALLLSKVGKDGLGKTLLTVVFFVVFMGIYMAIVFSLTQLEQSMPNGEITPEQLVALLQDAIANISAKMVYVHPNYVLAGSLVASSFGSWATNFLLILVEFSALGALAILIANPFYKHMLASQVEGGGGSGKKAKLTYDTKPTSVLKQLIVTDFKRTLRDSQLGFQSFAGIIMMPLIVVILGISMTQSAGEEAINFNDPFLQLLMPVILLVYLSLLGSVTNTLGLYPITRENNSFYVLKTLPISFEKILFAKVLLSTLLMVAVYLITTIVAVFILQISWYYAIGLMVVLSLLGFGTQCITTRIDLKEPKFGWSSFQQSLKNSKNSWMAMLASFIVMIVIGIIAVLFITAFIATESPIVVVLMWLALVVVSALYAFVSYKVLVNDAQKLFERIEG